MSSLSRYMSEMDKIAKVATKTDPAKWEAAKREAKAKMGGKHSARAMQLATQIYKKKGGGYSGAKPTSKNNSLKKWGKQKWRWSGEKKAGAQRLNRINRAAGKLKDKGLPIPDGLRRAGEVAEEKNLRRMYKTPSAEDATRQAGKHTTGDAMLDVGVVEGINYRDFLSKVREAKRKGLPQPPSRFYFPKTKKASEGKGVYLPAAKIRRLKSTPEGRKRLAAAARKKTEATRKGEQYSSHGLAAGTSLKEKRAYSIRGYLDGLTKIAVSTKDLYKGVRRAENVFIGTSRNPINVAVGGGGAITTPPKRVLKRNADKFIQKEKHQIERLERLAEKMPKRMKDEIKKRTEFDVEDFQRGLKELRGGLESSVIKNTQTLGLDIQAQGKRARDEIRKNRKTTAKNIKHYGARTPSPTEMKSGGYGVIGLDKDSISKILPALAGVPRKSGSKATDEINLRALIAAAGSHELAERAVKSKDVTRYASHLSPDVLMKEHNLLSRLEGPGADYTRKVMRGARKISGEAEDMEALLVEAFGPRASQFIQEGEKVPSAMRKALLSELRKDPALLDRAAKRAAKKRGVIGTAKSLAGRMAQFKRLIEAQGA